MTDKQLDRIFFAIAFLAALTIGVALAFSQEKLTLPKPQLKDSVALELKTLQLEVSEANVKLLQLQTQFTQIQQQQQQANGRFMEKLKAALKDSGIEEHDYEIDPQTLEVREKKKVTVPEKKP